ncbi:NAD(P)H-binding protein [Rhizomonospora bruguierae]|uniref:NAD(P)H-binding protein n=1 Tax=Rhizomonospora bruguierae TaxID=1581705 RepID=UPI001BCC857D|nr:NmrA family NAD(P)-binding protein [Micromonospora sp. NBRC 107566]
MITVTAATGNLGRLTVEALLDSGIAAGEIVAAVRSPRRAAHLAERGVQVRYANYDEPESLPAALAGTDRLLLVSGSEVGRRLAQHSAVVDAAVAAGVRFLAYTSILKADTSSVPLAAEHRATEEYIAATGLPHTFLRNAWYVENYTENLAPALANGVLLGAAGDGRVGAAPRADYAGAAAAVLTADAPADVYELAADHPFTMAELADEVSRQGFTKVAYQDLPVDEYAAALTGAGLSADYARVLAASDRAIAAGDLATDTGHLSTLLARPTTPLAESVAAALRRRQPA